MRRGQVRMSLDEDGVSGRVALFLANLRSRSNVTFYP